MRFILTPLLVLLTGLPQILFAAPSPGVSLLEVNETVVKLKVNIPRKFRGKNGKVVLQKQTTEDQYEKFAKKKLRATKKKKAIRLKLKDPLDYGAHFFRARVVAQGAGKSTWSDDIEVFKAIPFEPPLEELPEEIPPPPPVSPEWPMLAAGQQECPSGLGEAVLVEVNGYRAAIGLAPLVYHEALERSARRRSIDMALTGVLTHGNWLDEVIQELHGDFTLSRYAQNIAKHFQSAATVTAAWMDSPTHSQNILDPQLSALGTACVQAADGEYWWTQNFGGE